MNQSCLGKLAGEEILKQSGKNFIKKDEYNFTRPLMTSEDLMSNFISSGT